MGDPVTTALMVGKALLSTAATAAGTVGTTAAVAAGSYTAAKGLKNALTPDIPNVETPATAPVPDDQSRQQSQARQAQRRYAGQGRSGTVLSSSSGLG